MNEHKSKARLIAKRIVAYIAEDPILSAEWDDLACDVRESHVAGWTEIATEVLGEMEEPQDDAAMLKEVCKRIQPSAVMDYASRCWVEKDIAKARIVGPSRGLLTSCGCDYPHECEWCCGVGKVTHRAKRAKDEHDHIGERKEPESKTSEEFGEPETWTRFLFHSDWTDNFIHRMRKLGAVKIEVPASRSGSFSVEFDRGRPPPTPDPEGAGVE